MEEFKVVSRVGLVKSDTVKAVPENADKAHEEIIVSMKLFICRSHILL